jgi:phosphopantothenoylcysteine decarboxylase / phosphopantothenate---cysteine ligase
MRVLIAAGPTREFIDDIRFISNRSSGRMGLALAGEAKRRGWDATLVLGPSDCRPPSGIRVISVVSGDEMTDKALEELSTGYDAFICAAALADYTPVRKFKGKIRSGSGFSLELKPTRKLIAEARRNFPELVIVAFKAEYGGPMEVMLDAGKSLLAFADMVVLNDVSKDVFASDCIEAYIIGEGVEHVPRCEKSGLGEIILDRVECLIPGTG